jgi:hypothetical protein
MLRCRNVSVSSAHEEEVGVKIIEGGGWRISSSDAEERETESFTVGAVLDFAFPLYFDFGAEEDLIGLLPRGWGVVRRR